MQGAVQGIVFVVLAAIGFVLFGMGSAQALESAPLVLEYAAWLVFSGLAASAIRVANQWEKALVFRVGRFRAVRGPGTYLLLPLIDQAKTVDTRIQTLSIPTQQAITKDNVPVSLDGVIFLRVANPADAVIRVQDYLHAIRQYSQTALRDVIGAVTLDEILADREGVGKRIEEMVDREIVGWGLEVAAIRIQDLVLPEDLKRVMARQASAEREKRANITKSEGDVIAAKNLAEAAMTMSTSPGSMQLRTLQTVDGLGGSTSNTVVLAIPLEVTEAIRAVPQLAKALGQGITLGDASDQATDLAKQEREV